MVQVYELRSGSIVEYVGVSKNKLEYRLRDHTKCRGYTKGKFYGRTDLTIHAVSQWPTRKEALKEEGRLKLSYGLEWTETINRTTTMEIAREIKSKYIFRKYTYRMLAQDYNLTYSTVKNICQGRTYKEA